jgi:hypothetical protein
MIKLGRMWETKKHFSPASLLFLSYFLPYAILLNKSTVINAHNYETGRVASAYEHGIEPSRLREYGNFAFHQ